VCWQFRKRQSERLGRSFTPGCTFLLTDTFPMSILPTMKARYTTAEIAKAIRVSKKTLLRWLYAGKLAEPAKKITIGKIENRVWSSADLERARAFRESNYRRRS
jgi:hypothetical protein